MPTRWLSTSATVNCGAALGSANCNVGMYWSGRLSQRSLPSATICAVTVEAKDFDSDASRKTVWISTSSGLLRSVTP
jgi:hypothetical protein